MSRAGTRSIRSTRRRTRTLGAARDHWAVRRPLCVLALVLVSSATALATGASASSAPGAVRAPSRTPSRPVLALSARGIDGTTLGLGLAAALRELRARLGPHGRLVRDATNANCGYDAVATWPALTAFFFHDRFVGYSYGPTRTRAVPAAVATGGLRVGETTAQLRHLFGRRLRLSGEQGGVYVVATPAGRLDGFLTDEIGRPDARVASIEAGDVGCPAMSP